MSPRGTLYGLPLLSRGRPQFQVFPARDGSFHLLGVGEEGRAPSPRLARALPSAPASTFCSLQAVKRHAIYSIRILNQRFWSRA